MLEGGHTALAAYTSTAPPSSTSSQSSPGSSNSLHSLSPPVSPYDAGPPPTYQQHLNMVNRKRKMLPTDSTTTVATSDCPVSCVCLCVLLSRLVPELQSLLEIGGNYAKSHGSQNCLILYIEHIGYLAMHVRRRSEETEHMFFVIFVIKILNNEVIKYLISYPFL